MIEQVGIIYGQIIVQFLLELCAFTTIISRFFTRRKYFVIRLVASLLILFACGFGMSFFYYQFGDTVWGRVITYFTLFALVTLLLKVIFKENILLLVFATSIAYALQNVMYKLWLLFYVFCEQIGWADSWGSRFTFIYHVLYYSYITVFVIIIAFIFMKFIHKKFNDKIFNIKILAIAGFCLIATIVLCSYQDVYFGQFSTVRENHFDDPSFYYLRQSGNLLSLLTCILVLYLGFKSANESRLAKEVEYLEYTIKQSKQQYEISKDVIEMINIKCHDIKYQIRSLAASGEINEEELKKLEESVNIYDSKFDTGNKLLNVLLWEKNSFAEQHKITFSCMIDGTNFDFMEAGDLYCMFGNIIDNALEATLKIKKDKSNRVINLTVKRKGNLVIIEEENYYIGKLDFKDGLPVTTKDDENYHGFGTRSLRFIVRKYGGEMTTSSENNIFHLSIILPVDAAK